MQSSVGGLLHEPLSANAQSAIFVPWILASLAESIPLLTQANRAHLVSIRAVGLVSSADAAVLSRAISQLAEEGVSEICVDGALEDVYFNYEARLMAIAGREIGARLHVARSRNDLQATLDRLRARRIGLALAEGLLQLRGTLQREAPRYFDCVMSCTALRRFFRWWASSSQVRSRSERSHSSSGLEASGGAD
jgi:argininosuccinate lyase